jgi:hypothetical protein
MKSFQEQKELNLQNLQLPDFKNSTVQPFALHKNTKECNAMLCDAGVAGSTVK